MTDWFNCDKLQITTGRNTIYLLDEVSSTNDFLLGKISNTKATVCRFINHRWHSKEQIVYAADIQKNTIAIAKTQTKGRGRMGRSWFDGGLQMSWDISDEIKSGFSVWIGVICATAIRKSTGQNVMLKWPNDLYLDEKKMAGILVDRICSSGGSKLVSGIGINLGTVLPAELNASSLPGVSMEMLVGEIINEHDNNLHSFINSGWRSWSQKFMELDYLFGRQITVQGKSPGIASGIADSGALIITMPDGSTVESFASETHITEIK
ncbi:MAG: biotin--[acetyl-CoA-carboxylase] ligase [bacterium]|nr:biotin--[acetyl-CoA-carboxylase] ligase [bacterium]